MQVEPPLFYSKKPDCPRPRQKPMECVLWAINQSMSPGDGSQVGLPLEIMIRWQLSELHTKLASNDLWPCDFLSEFKRIKKAAQTGLCGFQDIRMYLTKFVRGLTFKKLKKEAGKDVVPLSKVICTDHYLYVLCFVLSAWIVCDMK